MYWWKLDITGIKSKLLNAFIYFNAISPLYRDVTVDSSEIPNDLMRLSDQIWLSDVPIGFTADSSTTQPENRAKIQNRTESKFWQS